MMSLLLLLQFIEMHFLKNCVFYSSCFFGYLLSHTLAKQQDDDNNRETFWAKNILKTLPYQIRKPVSKKDLFGAYLLQGLLV